MDVIGILGLSDNNGVGTHTAYTVPAGKSAKIKIMYRGVVGTNSTLSIAVAGCTIFTTAALTAGQLSFTTTGAMHVADAVADVSGGTDATTVAPGPKEYYLSENQQVQFTIGTDAFTSMIFQVVGVEVDAA